MPLKSADDASVEGGKGVSARVLAWPSIRGGGGARGEGGGVGAGVDVVVPAVGRERRIRERGLNELAWRLAWVGAKRIRRRKVFLQRCCEFLSLFFWPSFFVVFDTFFIFGRRGKRR